MAFAEAELSSNSSYSASSTIFSFHDGNTEANKQSKKQIKEEINQSLVDSYNSSNCNLNNGSHITMSENMASAMSQITLNSETEFDSSTLITSDELLSSQKSGRSEYGVRATPKQVFPNIACLPVENNPIFCYILSVWDNIVGPQTVYVWKRKTKIKSYNLETHYYTKNCKDNNKESQGNEAPHHDLKKTDKESASEASSTEFKQVLSYLLDESKAKNVNHQQSHLSHPKNAEKSVPRRICLSTVVKYVTEHTVGIGESGQWRANKMVSFFLSVPHQDVLILSVRFHVIEEGLGVPYCLSVVFPHHEEHHLRSTFNLCTEALYRIAAKIRLLITKEGLESGDKVREDLIDVCTTLAALAEAGLSHYPLLALARPPDDRRLAERILTSHLQTLGSTVVISDSPSDANRVVMWLGQFLSEEDQRLSRIALSDQRWPFQPGLALQAVIRDGAGAVGVCSRLLLASRRPVTLVDLAARSVRQMPSAHAHTRHCCAALRTQLLAAWHDIEQLPAPSQSLFEPVEEVAPMAKRLLHEWDRLSSCPINVRSAFLCSFRRSLRYSALALIAWTRHEWTRESRRRDPRSLLPSLSAALRLEAADVRILLAQAEALQSGFLASLFDKAQ